MSECLIKVDLLTFAQNTQKANYVIYNLIDQLNKSNVSVELVNFESFVIQGAGGVNQVDVLKALPLKDDVASQANYFIKLDLVKLRENVGLFDYVLPEIFQRKVKIELVNTISSPVDDWGTMVDHETYEFLQFLPQVI